MKRLAAPIHPFTLRRRLRCLLPVSVDAARPQPPAFIPIVTSGHNLGPRPRTPRPHTPTHTTLRAPLHALFHRSRLPREPLLRSSPRSDVHSPSFIHSQASLLSSSPGRRPLRSSPPPSDIFLSRPACITALYRLLCTHTRCCTCSSISASAANLQTERRCPHSGHDS